MSMSPNAAGYPVELNRHNIPAYHGEHYWVVIILFALDDPTVSKELALDQVAGTLGPRCFYCSQMWRKGDDPNTPCPGGNNPV